MKNMQKQSGIVETASPVNQKSPSFNDRSDLKRTDIEFFRTILEKTVSNPQTSRFRSKIRKFEMAYADHLKNTRLFISRPNQFPDYRTIILMGSGLLNSDSEYNLKSNPNCDCIGVIGVTADGRLVSDRMELEPDTNPSIFSMISEFNRNGKNMNFHIPLDMSGFHKNSSYCISDKKTHYFDDLLPSLKFDTKKKILKYIDHEIQDHFKLIFRTLRDAIDKDVLKIMYDTYPVSIHHGKWLTGGDGVSKEIILARQQAVKAYPILANRFSHVVHKPLHQAIDARTSLSDAIASYFKVDKYKVRRIQGLTCQQAGANQSNSGTRIRDILDLPNGVVPENREQFRKIDVLKEFGESVFKMNLSDTMNRLSEDGNPWRLVERMEQTSGLDVADSIDFLVRKLYIPALFNRIGTLAAHHGITANFNSTAGLDPDTPFFYQCFDDVCSMFAPAGLLDWSERYHRNIARYEDLLDTVSSEQTWPGLLNRIDFGNGYIARELTSAQALRIQGKMENHCVGGYLSQVISGENRKREFRLIFSIEKNDRICSTAEIICSRKSVASINDTHSCLQSRVRQNLAYGNKASSRDADRVSDMIVDRLSGIDFSTCQTYLDGLEHARLEYDRESNIDEHIRFCGFDPLDRTMMKRAWDELSPALPRSVRKGGPGKFIDQVQVSRFFWSEILGDCGVNYPGRGCANNDDQKLEISIET